MLTAKLWTYQNIKPDKNKKKSKWIKKWTNWKLLLFAIETTDESNRLNIWWKIIFQHYPDTEKKELEKFISIKTISVI